MAGIESDGAAAIERAAYDDRMHASARSCIDAAGVIGTPAAVRFAQWAIDASCDAAAARGGWRAALRRRRMLGLRATAAGFTVWGS